jgi:CO dehydrogenase nickel-insertion accessory protein CooC1
MTHFADQAVVALPVVLIVLDLALNGRRQAEDVETFSTNIAAQEIFLVTERATEVTQLLI